MCIRDSVSDGQKPGVWFLSLDAARLTAVWFARWRFNLPYFCLLYTSDAADERSSVDLGGRRIIKKKTRVQTGTCAVIWTQKTNIDNIELSDG